MASGVLQHVSLSYQLLWGAQRQIAGVRLCVDAHDDGAFDTAHFVATLHEQWHASSPPLLLSTASDSVQTDLLDLMPPALARLEVSDSQLQNPSIVQRVMRARQGGASLVWRGEPGGSFKAAYTGCFAQSILGLSTEEALICLRISLRNHNGNPPRPGANSPVRPGQIYEGVASHVLAEHCLDEHGASALLGWPMEDVLHGYRHSRIQPAQHAIGRLVKAIDADASMDEIEKWLGEEPMLAYRFLRYANSAGLGLNREVTALRQGLMVLGLTRVKSWLLEQIPHAASDLNLKPVRTAMVLRAQIMAELLDAGEGEALKRELYLCGLLSQIDLLLGEPMPGALHAIPLPERITTAIVGQSGPYWPYLEVVTALETPHTAATRSLCATHGFDEEDVNRALLRTLAALPARTD